MNNMFLENEDVRWARQKESFLYPLVPFVLLLLAVLSAWAALCVGYSQIRADSRCARFGYPKAVLRSEGYYCVGHSEMGADSMVFLGEEK